MLAFASNEVHSTTRLRSTGVPGIDDVVVKSVAELGQVFGDGAPVLRGVSQYLFISRHQGGV